MDLLIYSSILILFIFIVGRLSSEQPYFYDLNHFVLLF